jgi:hypothetical protein
LVVANNVYKVLLTVDEGRSLVAMEAIRYENRLWLVPAWRLQANAAYRTPLRMICLDNIRHDTLPWDAPADLLVLDALPESIFAGPVGDDVLARYHVVERPVGVRVPAEPEAEFRQPSSA